MSDAPFLVVSLLAGALLGTLFLSGLWWTLRLGLGQRHAALWIVLSSQLRTAVVVIGFYIIGRNDWHRLVAAVAGFFIARVSISLWQRYSRAAPINMSRQGSD